MKEIKLTQGKVTLVDDEDYAELMKHKWCAVISNHNTYVVRGVRKKNKCYNIFMHRQILKTPKGMVSDHIDRNGLNNQKKNLRICSYAENLWNRGKTSHNSSGFKGVTWSKERSKFKAQIRFKGKQHNLGYFVDPEKAAIVRNAKCRELHGEFASLNFPDNERRTT